MRLEGLGFAVTLLCGLIPSDTRLVSTGTDVVSLSTTTVARLAGAVPTFVRVVTGVTRRISTFSGGVTPLGADVTSRPCGVAFVAGVIPSSTGFTHDAAPSSRRPSGVVRSSVPRRRRPRGWPRAG
jgi:hypothetical protein